MNRRIVPFSLVLAGSLLAYACSSSDDSASPQPTDDGGSSGTSGTSGMSSGSSGDGGSSGSSGEGGTTDGGSGNPISGAALTEVPGFASPAVFVEPPVFANGNLYFSAFGSPSTFVQLVLPGNTTNGLHTSATTEAYVGSTYDTHTSKLLTAAPTTNADGSPGTGGGTIYSWAVPTTTDGTTVATPVALTMTFAADAGQANFDSPHHIAPRKDGTLFITDGAFQLDAASLGNLTHNHVWTAIPTATAGTYTVINNIVDGQPSGVALSADEKTLYVALSAPTNAPAAIVKYTVAANGSLSATSTPFVSIGAIQTTTSTGLDGLALDSAGNLYAAYATGVDVYKPDGTKWGTLNMGKPATSVAFAGTGLKTLYVAGTADLWTTTVNVAGLVP